MTFQPLADSSESAMGWVVPAVRNEEMKMPTQHQPDIYKSEYFGDDQALFTAAKEMAKKLGRPVLIDYSGALMTIREDDFGFDPEGNIMADCC